MLVHSVEQWLARGVRKPALVLHTSSVSYGTEILRSLSGLQLPWLLPDNVYWELTILSESRCFGAAASYILAAGQRVCWDLEQLYATSSAGQDRCQLWNGEMLFLFGDLAKQREFASHMQPLAQGYLLNNTSWLCRRDTGSVCAFSDPGIREKVTPVILSPGMWSPAFGQEDFLYVQGSSQKVSCRDLRKTGKSGNYADLYTWDAAPGKYLKIYRNCTYSDMYLKKIQLFSRLAGKLPDYPLALPEELLLMPNGRLAGYTMKTCCGKVMRNYVICGWDGQSLERVIRNLLRLLLELHCMHIQVNDLSVNNILVDDNGQVSIVDCDSFQYADFPGGCMTPIYQHPELLAAEPYKTLHEPRHEYFSFAVLLFQCLFYCDPLGLELEKDTPDKPDWKNSSFRLDTDADAASCVNRDVWHIWQQQEPGLRKLFSDVFHFREDISFGAWIRELER